MLERLLIEIQNSGTVNSATLANRLNTSIAMVDALMDELKRRGLLREVSLNRNESCGGCSLANSCVSSCKSSRIWEVAGFHSDKSKQSEPQV